MGYTQKQIDKYNRQKYITELEKIGKNLFRMFRENQTNAQQFISKFEQLKKRLEERVDVQLDSAYHRELKAYIARVYRMTCETDGFDDLKYENIKEAEMSNLNRLQKLKNKTSYKKDKHKSHNREWDR